VKAPEPRVSSWHGHELHVRHDDPHLSTDSGWGQTTRAVALLANDVKGPRLVLQSALESQHRVKASEDGPAVGLWRR
jgi:hypothetical protein